MLRGCVDGVLSVFIYSTPRTLLIFRSKHGMAPFNGNSVESLYKVEGVYICIKAVAVLACMGDWLQGPMQVKMNAALSR